MGGVVSSYSFVILPTPTTPWTPAGAPQMQCRAKELLDGEGDSEEDLVAAEREQQPGEPQREQRPCGDEGHLDADVESEQEGSAAAAAVRQRGGGASAAAAAGGGLTGHLLPSVAGHPLPSPTAHPLGALPVAHPLPSVAGHPLPSPPKGHPLAGDAMSD